MRTRRSTRSLLVASGVASLAGVLCFAGLASAHAHPKVFVPAANSIVTSAPDKLDLTFTEELKSLHVQVYDIKGQAVLDTMPTPDAKDLTHAIVPLNSSLPTGTYTVKWDAVATDGHESNNRYNFTITTPSQPNAIRVFVGGQEVKSDVPVQIVNGHTMVPVRAIAEALGKWVDWDPNQHIVTVSEAPSTHMHPAAYQNPAGTPVPTLKLTVTPDSMEGFNVKVEPTNFTWAPDKAGSADAPGQGHGHIYVDGVMVGRVYGTWYHLDALTPGQHDVRVTLNANSHAEYAVNGAVVEATVSVVQGADMASTTGGSAVSAPAPATMPAAGD